eukprot:361306-Chlamydomonas_euryale.AAC.2
MSCVGRGISTSHLPFFLWASLPRICSSNILEAPSWHPPHARLSLPSPRRARHSDLPVRPRWHGANNHTSQQGLLIAYSCSSRPFPAILGFLQPLHLHTRHGSHWTGHIPVLQDDR